MIPLFSQRAWLLIGLCIFACTLGAAISSVPLLVVGGLVFIFFVSYFAWFYPLAIALRQKRFELSWWLADDQRAQVGGVLNLQLAFRNHSLRQVLVADYKIFCTDGIVPENGKAVLVESGRHLELSAVLRLTSPGMHVMHGAKLNICDPFALFRVPAYFPNPIRIEVWPAQKPPLSELLTSASPMVIAGARTNMRKGIGENLRELRSFSHGDGFRKIAWKATAKRGKLLVREFEVEMQTRSMLAIGTIPSAISQSSDIAPLDRVMAQASSLIHRASQDGTPIGLATFDEKLASWFAPDLGAAHVLKLRHHLLWQKRNVSQTATDCTAAELVAQLALYLAHQEAIDCRIGRVPPLDDPRWEHVQAGPDGRLYDLTLMDSVIANLLHSKPMALSLASLRSGLVTPFDDDPRLARFREFCAIRGIELPTKQSTSEVDAISLDAGLAALLERCLTLQGLSNLVIFMTVSGPFSRGERVTSLLARLHKKQIAVSLSVLPQSHDETNWLGRLNNAESALHKRELEKWFATRHVRIFGHGAAVGKAY